MRLILLLLPQFVVKYSGLNLSLFNPENSEMNVLKHSNHVFYYNISKFICVIQTWIISFAMHFPRRHCMHYFKILVLHSLVGKRPMSYCFTISL